MAKKMVKKIGRPKKQNTTSGNGNGNNNDSPEQHPLFALATIRLECLEQANRWGEQKATDVVIADAQLMFDFATGQPTAKPEPEPIDSVSTESGEVQY